MSVDKKIFAALLSLSFFSLLFHASPGYAGEGRLKACVVYDAAMRFGNEQPTLVSLREYLGHFDLEQRALAVRDWKPGALRGADIVFFLGLRDSALLMRIEDVSPFVSAETLQELVDAIEQYDIPYAIGVISVGMIEGGGRVLLHENPELVEVLRRAQENGASIIMHGYAHQNEFSPTTGEGWEFWNVREDRPMEDDEAFTRDRIEKAFIELARCGLYPVAFEAPHYAMSKKGYEVLSEYFNVYSGMPQTSDTSYEVSMTLPYIVKSQHLNGMILLPENMGYYDGVEYRVGDMLNSSKALLGIENSFACFFYHGFLPPENLRKIIEVVQAQGFTFFDLRTMEIRAESPQVRVLVQNGKVSATVDSNLVAQWKKKGFFDPRYDFETLSWIQIAVLALVICSFLGIIANLKRTAWRKYEM